MGPLFAFILAIVVGVSVGLVAGFFVSYVIIPIIYRLLKTPIEKQRIKGLVKIVLAFSIAGLIVIAAGGSILYGMYYEIKYANDYWKSRGFGDSFRIPLERPYELFSIDDATDAELRVWKEEQVILRGIIKYHKRGFLIVGEYYRAVEQYRTPFELVCQILV